MLSTAAGFQSMLKEGARHYQGLEEAILKNIQACKEISNMTKTSLGPNGMKKMVVNHIDKIFVTSDAATILKEMEIQHPAAKMILMAAKMQETEQGDATNFVITLAGELFLIKLGLHPSQIVVGYETALKSALDLLDQQKVWEITNVAEETQVLQAIRTSLSSKLSDYSNLIAGLVLFQQFRIVIFVIKNVILKSNNYQIFKIINFYICQVQKQYSVIYQTITKACIRCLPKEKTNFDSEYVRVTKILGGSVLDSHVLSGLIVTRNVEGQINRLENPKICVFNAPLDAQSQETKGTVLIKNATELMNYTKSEEELAEKIVKSIADAGVNLIVAGGSISELVLHFVEKYKMMIVKVQSKFELKRLCKAIGASALSRLSAPMPDELGTQIGSQKVTIFEKQSDTCKLATIVLRGATQNLLDDIERAIDDGVSCYKSLIKDPRFVYGGGATEIKLAQLLEQEANKIKSIDQYAYRQYAQAFEIIPRILIENAGLAQNEMMAQLHKLNSEKPHSLNIQTATLSPSQDLKVFDHLKTKWWAIKLATDAAVTILRVDQIIIAKPAGGPKMPDRGHWDDQD